MKLLFINMGLILVFVSAAVAVRYSKKTPTVGINEPYVFDTLASNLTVPWSMVFIDDETILFSERNGRMRLLRNERLVPDPVLVITDIDTTKKMGLLGICLHPQFGQNKYVYISYNYRRNNMAMLRVARYTFLESRLVNPEVMIEGISGSTNHTGCRLQFGPDKKLYITSGDADRPVLAQDLKKLNGKILRLNDDGTIPSDNPFAHNDTARREIWSYGHRNPQGIAFQPQTGDLYESEHGPTGGDEVNIIQKGMNYGWPFIHHEQTNDHMISPLKEFTQSVGPSEIIFYKGIVFPQFNGSLLMASLRGEALYKFDLADRKIVAMEMLFKNNYGRIRALAADSRGYIYFSTSQNDPPEGKPRDGYDMIIRMRPSGSYQVTGQTKTLNDLKVAPLLKRKTAKALFTELCAGCHGQFLEGTERVRSLRESSKEYGSSKEAIVAVIRNGVIQKGMPAWEGALTKKEINKLADYIIQLNVKTKRK